MSWLSKLLTSSIGQKIIMSLTGLFLCLFLVVHLAGNLQLLIDDGGLAFDKYTYKMTHSPLIKIISYGNYFFILLHAVQGIWLKYRNSKARGVSYAKGSSKTASFSSRYMAVLGMVILFFIIVHLANFWYVMKFGSLQTEIIDGKEIKRLYPLVVTVFSQWWYVLIYVIGLLGLAYHLWHGFASAFQSVGLSHPKYTPIIRTVGYIFSVVVPVGFALIPLYFFFQTLNLI